MIEFLAPLTKRVGDLWTNYTSTRAAKLDNLDAAISSISPIASVQEGTITISNGSTSNTATITSVNTAKSALANLGVRTNSSVTTFTDAGVEVSLTNSTTVTAQRNGSTGSVTVRFRVVEFK